MAMEVGLAIRRRGFECEAGLIDSVCLDYMSAIDSLILISSMFAISIVLQSHLGWILVELGTYKA